MREIHEDTANANAMVYLDDSSHEISRMDFLEQVHNGQWSYMLYVGGGYVPLRVAVTTNSHRHFQVSGESEAIETFEEWAREERPEEIGEGPDYEKEVQEAIAAGEEPPTPEYELYMEVVPQDAGTEPASIAQEFLIDGAGNVLLDGKEVGNALDEKFGAKLTYGDFELLRAWKEMYERLVQWVEEGKKIRALVYARRTAGQKDGRVGLSLSFEPMGRGKRWGEGAQAHIGAALSSLVEELKDHGWAAEARPTPMGYELLVEDKDFDGFHWTHLEIPLRSYKLTDYLVVP